jgi:hypothetical protein
MMAPSRLVRTLPLEMIGRLCLRHPLPAVVFSRVHPGTQVIEVANTRDALGFQMPMFLATIHARQIGPRLFVLMVKFHIPAPVDVIADRWGRVIQNSEPVFDTMSLGAGKALGRTVIDYRAAQPLLDAPRQAVSHSHRIACCWASRLPVVHADRQGSAGVHPLAWLHAWDIRFRAEHSALAQGYSPVNRRRLVRKAVEHERSSRRRTKPILKSDWQATESFSSRSPGMAVARGACVTLPCASHICVLRIDGT